MKHKWTIVVETASANKETIAAQEKPLLLFQMLDVLAGFLDVFWRLGVWVVIGLAILSLFGVHA